MPRPNPPLLVHFSTAGIHPLLPAIDTLPTAQIRKTYKPTCIGPHSPYHEPQTPSGPTANSYTFAINALSPTNAALPTSNYCRSSIRFTENLYYTCRFAQYYRLRGSNRAKQLWCCFDISAQSSEQYLLILSDRDARSDNSLSVH